MSPDFFVTYLPDRSLFCRKTQRFSDKILDEIATANADRTFPPLAVIPVVLYLRNQFAIGSSNYVNLLSIGTPCQACWYLQSCGNNLVVRA